MHTAVNSLLYSVVSRILHTCIYMYIHTYIILFFLVELVYVRLVHAHPNNYLSFYHRPTRKDGGDLQDTFSLSGSKFSVLSVCTKKSLVQGPEIY